MRKRRSKTKGKYKCIICRKHYNSDRALHKLGVPAESIKWVLCGKCNRNWLWYSKGRYIRKRTPEDKWTNQMQLYGSVVEVCKSLGVDRRAVVTEVGFPDWGMTRKSGLLRFDIAVPKLKLLIDYHGVQHYKARNRYHKTTAQFKYQQENDQLKRKVAGVNGWNYVIFPYREAVENIQWVARKLDPVLHR